MAQKKKKSSAKKSPKSSVKKSPAKSPVTSAKKSSRPKSEKSVSFSSKPSGASFEDIVIEEQPISQGTPVVLQYPYATFNERMLATIIDMILSIFLLLPLLPVTQEYPEQMREIIQQMQQQIITPQEFWLAFSDYMFNQGGAAAYVADRVIEFTLSGVVVLLFWFYRGATPGKMLLKMKIVDQRTGRAPSLTRLVIRYLGYMVSSVPLFLGFVWIMFSRKNQGWHDLLSGTVVIKTVERHSRFRFFKETFYLILAFLVLFAALLMMQP